MAGIQSERFTVHRSADPSTLMVTLTHWVSANHSQQMGWGGLGDLAMALGLPPHPVPRRVLPVVSDRLDLLVSAVRALFLNQIPSASEGLPCPALEGDVLAQSLFCSFPSITGCIPEPASERVNVRLSKRASEYTCE